MTRFPRTLLLALALASLLPAASAARASPAEAAAPLPPELPAGAPNAPVDAIDLARYVGVWHEVARLPMFFQRRCARDTTATYARLDDGGLSVVNRCVAADGDVIAVSGVARATERAGALEVSFLPRALSWLPFGWADYWVIDLDPDYRWAVVGGPSRGALWVLARDPAIDPALLERLRQRAEARGYDLGELIVAPAPAGAGVSGVTR